MLSRSFCTSCFSRSVCCFSRICLKCFVAHFCVHHLTNCLQNRICSSHCSCRGPASMPNWTEGQKAMHGASVPCKDAMAHLVQYPEPLHLQLQETHHMQGRPIRNFPATTLVSSGCLITETRLKQHESQTRSISTMSTLPIRIALHSHFRKTCQSIGPSLSAWRNCLPVP